MANVTFENVRKSFGTFTALENLNLAIEDGEFVALLGPSGCGKSTTLRMLAGLEFPTSGEIRIGDRVVNDLAPGKRDIAMVFQSYALYPHMTVGENIAYPLKKRGIKGPERKAAVQKAAELLQLDALLDRKPGQLSGGQQQRVALGRALVREPRVFLLDEPLSNLDAKLRSYMRAEIIELHRRLGKTMVYVTHDQLEAMTMANRIAVMHAGKVQQFDTPDAIYNRPANRFVAGFIGTPPMNQIEGEVRGDSFVTEGHAIPLDRSAFVATLADGPAILGVRPEGIVIGTGTGLPATVRLAENTGHETIVTLELPDRSRIAARIPATRRMDVGQRVALTVDPGAIHLFEATETGARLNRDPAAPVVPLRSTQEGL